MSSLNPDFGVVRIPVDPGFAPNSPRDRPPRPFMEGIAPELQARIAQFLNREPFIIENKLWVCTMRRGGIVFIGIGDSPRPNDPADFPPNAIIADVTHDEACLIVDTQNRIIMDVARTPRHWYVMVQRIAARPTHSPNVAADLATA